MPPVTPSKTLRLCDAAIELAETELLWEVLMAAHYGGRCSPRQTTDGNVLMPPLSGQTHGYRAWSSRERRRDNGDPGMEYPDVDTRLACRRAAA